MPKFPFTNYHELNLDWILKKVNALFDASEENARTIRTYDTRLSSAEQTATSAATAATSAQQLADAAAATAGNALSVAGTANTKADSALTAATDASSAVSSALTIAQEAQQTAGAAAATANDAAATAAGLESLANTANQNATAAVETAGTAVTTANNAAAAAQTADQKAVAAQQTANSAQTAANTNAGNISTLQSDVSELNRQISEKADVIISSASGSIASFADGADDMPIKSLIVNIEPVQTGSGEPSPTNIRPISGHTGASVTRTGKNMLNHLSESSAQIGGITFAKDGHGSIDISGTATSTYPQDSLQDQSGNMINTVIVPTGTTVTLSVTADNVPNDALVYAVWYERKTASTTINEYAHSTINTGKVTFTTVEPYVNLIIVAQGNGITYANTKAHVQLEYGDVSTDFEPCTADTYPIPLGDTVYGGTLDVTTGKLTVTDANIASYNGETLTGEWISDRDVYAAGTTPTTGAQVVYELATPQTYQLTPQQLDTLLGTNNIWTDVGTIDVEYPADTKLYIDGKIAELQALVLEN